MRQVSPSAARAAAAFLLICISSMATAAGWQPFNAAAFKAAQAAGQPIVVEIHADWCPECKAQNRVPVRHAVQLQLFSHCFLPGSPALRG